MFGRDLRAAVPAVRKVRAGTDTRRHIYKGVGIVTSYTSR